MYVAKLLVYEIDKKDRSKYAEIPYYERKHLRVFDHSIYIADYL